MDKYMNFLYINSNMTKSKVYPSERVQNSCSFGYGFIIYIIIWQAAKMYRV